MILADSLPEYASSNFAISSKSTESSSDTFLRFKSSRFFRAIRLGKPIRTLFSKRRRKASSISRSMWFNSSLDPLKFPFTRETDAKKKHRVIFQNFNSWTIILQLYKKTTIWQFTSHSVYVATSIKSNGVKIDGFYIQILCRLNKCKRKVPTPSLLTKSLFFSKPTLEKIWENIFFRSEDGGTFRVYFWNSHKILDVKTINPNSVWFDRSCNIGWVTSELAIWQNWCFGLFYCFKIEVLQTCSTFVCVKFLWWEGIWEDWNKN